MGKFQKGHIGWNKGKTGVYSAETLEKKRLAGLGRTHTKKTRKKLSKNHKEWWLIPENKAKMVEKFKVAGTRKIGTVGPNKGKPAWNSGKKGCFSPETIERMKVAARGKRAGEKNGRWRGGKSFEPYSTDWTESLRISIRERDKYICQGCFSKQGDITFDVHHIDYDKQNCNPTNLILLCRQCHGQTTWGDRKHWTKFYRDIMDSK